MDKMISTGFYQGMRTYLATNAATVAVLGVIVLVFCMALIAGVLHQQPEPDIVMQPSAYGLPVRLRIPRIRVDAAISGVAFTPQGGMDIPDSALEAGWFTPGVRPGDLGNAVIAGHLDTALSTPGIFWDLHRLKPGDEIQVETDQKEVLTFIVERMELYPYDNAPMTEIFGSSTGSKLNLVTCSGQWNKQTYSERLVVFTKKNITVNE